MTLPQDLIVSRLADMKHMHPRQDSSKVCAKCLASVGIYPSGQRVLLARPDTRIVCSHCAEPRYEIGYHAPGADQDRAEQLPVIDQDQE